MANDSRSPRWGNQAEELAAEYVESFQKNLRRITVRLAIHEEAETIDQRHVRKAHDSLVECGYDRLPSWKRPQAKITVAGFCLGLAIATPDLAPVLAFGHRTAEVVICWVGLLVFSVLALILYGMGWAQHRL